MRIAHILAVSDMGRMPWFEMWWLPPHRSMTTCVTIGPFLTTCMVDVDCHRLWRIDDVRLEFNQIQRSKTNIGPVSEAVKSNEDDKRSQYPAMVSKNSISSDTKKIASGNGFQFDELCSIWHSESSQTRLHCCLELQFEGGWFWLTVSPVRPTPQPWALVPNAGEQRVQSSVYCINQWAWPRR